jgi:hypothetical protein
MNEFGAQLDRHRSGTIALCEDASPNPLARFDHNDIEPSVVQCARRADTRSAGAYDEHVRVHLRSGHKEELAGAVPNAIAWAATSTVHCGRAMRAPALHMLWLVFPKEGYMSIRHAFSLIGAALVSWTAVAFTNTHDLTAAARLDDNDTPVTLVGCVMKEKDYRKQHDIGTGGWLNTGAGDGNEYVLVDAVPGPVNQITPAEADCSTRVGGRDYELKGRAERKRNLEAFVGRRIEISGMLEHADTEVTVGTTGDVVATRPTGGNVSQPRALDLKLFEVKMDAFREIPIAQPVAAAPEPAVIAPAPEPPPAAAAPEPAPVPQAPAPAPAPAVREQLPRTASPMALAGLLGLLSMGGAFGLRTWRLR